MTLHPFVAIVPLALVGCGVTQGCPDLERCVSSQAEADRLNAGASCPEYVYCPPGDGGPADATVAGEDAGSPGFPDVGEPEAPEFIDAGCVDGALPPGMGVPFPCGDASCWSGSQYCTSGSTVGGFVCAPMPCRCGAVPTCSCLYGCPFETCTEDDAGGLRQSCSCP